MADSLLVAISTIAHGSMSVGVTDDERGSNRTRFLKNNGITPAQTTLVSLSYDTDDYKRFFTISSNFAGDGMLAPATLTADGLFTTDKNLALFLPVADCIGAVFFDPKNQAIGLSHLGRHNLMQDGGKASVEYMMYEFGTDPLDLEIWLSPSVGRESYPLYDFDNRSLNEVALEQFINAGVSSQNVSIDHRDTAKDQALFSHSEFLKGNRSIDGRQAVVAMMRP